jgi:acetyl-CoA synthetase
MIAISDILTPQLAFEYLRIAEMETLEEKASLWMKIVRYAGKEADVESLFNIYLQIFKNEELPIAWMPDEKILKEANITSLMKELNLKTYQDLHKWSVENRGEFWKRTIERIGIKFQKPYNKILDLSKGVEDPIWLAEAEMNITDSCFSAAADHTAIISCFEGSTGLQKVSYRELRTMVNRAASGLLDNGFEAGDSLVIYMPLALESIVAYLAIIRAGMIVVSVADSYSPSELRKRIAMTKAKGIITCDGYTYNGKRFKILNKVREATSIKTLICYYFEKPIKRANEILWDELHGNEDFDAIIGKPDDVTNILFSSGTTKEPKAIPFTHLTPIKCASDGYYHHDIKPLDVVTWTTGMGWMMAPWLIYAVFLNKATLAVYTGAATGLGYGKFIEQAGITILGTIPSVVKAWRNNNFDDKFSWKVRVYSSTGEPSNAEDNFYLMSLTDFRAPVIEYCGGTEIGGGYITGTLVQPASPATFTTPALGLNFYLLDQDYKPVQDGQAGEVFIVPPSIGLTQRLLNRDHHEEYYVGLPKGYHGEILRKHGDAFETIEGLGNTFYKSVGRIDDIMNLGGIKISSLEIETVINKHPKIFESAAISVPEKGQGPEKLVVYYSSNEESKDEVILKTEFQKFISRELSPLFKIAEIVRVDSLPRTSSDKLMRRELRKQFMMQPKGVGL